MVWNEVSLRCYLERLTSSKIRKEKKTDSVPQSQILAVVKTLGLVGLSATFEAVFFYVLGGKFFLKFKKNIL